MRWYRWRVLLSSKNRVKNYEKFDWQITSTHLKRIKKPKRCPANIISNIKTVPAPKTNIKQKYLKMTLVPSESRTTAVAATLAETNSTALSSTQLNVSLDPFGGYGKPNAIVRPVRRNELNDEMIQSSLQPSQPLPTTTQMNNGNTRNDDPKKIQRDVEFSFTKELDFKLKHLQRDKKASSKNVNFYIFVVVVVEFKSILRNRRFVVSIRFDSGRTVGRTVVEVTTRTTCNVYIHPIHPSIHSVSSHHSLHSPPAAYKWNTIKFELLIYFFYTCMLNCSMLTTNRAHNNICFRFEKKK